MVKLILLFKDKGFRPLEMDIMIYICIHLI